MDCDGNNDDAEETEDLKTMKLNVISDLHCALKTDGSIEWYDFEPEKLEPADYLVVAGDSGHALTERRIHADLRKRTKGKFKKVLTIKGNHSYWVFAEEAEDPETADELVMAPNDKIDLVDGDVAVIGTTLWTNSCSFSEIRHMNDYNYIPDFKPELQLKRYAKESRWIREKWQEYKNAGKKVVIVTHHNPRDINQLPEYSLEHEDVRTAYWIDDKSMDDVKPDLWICGHIHENFDGEIDGVRFVRHPIGYRFGWYHVDVKKHPKYQSVIDSWYNKVVEV